MSKVEVRRNDAGEKEKEHYPGGMDGQSKDWEVGESQESVPTASNGLAGMPGPFGAHSGHRWGESVTRLSLKDVSCCFT